MSGPALAMLSFMAVVLIFLMGYFLLKSSLHIFGSYKLDTREWEIGDILEDFTTTTEGKEYFLVTFSALRDGNIIVESYGRFREYPIKDITYVTNKSLNARKNKLTQEKLRVYVDSYKEASEL